MRDGWNRTTIGEACEVVNGGTPRTDVSEYWGGDHQWITPAEMGKRPTPYIAATERTLTEAGLRDSSARMLPPRSVILSSRAPIGHLVINTVPMGTNQGCKGLVPGKELHYKFLYYYLSGIVDELNALGTGATFRELSAGKLKEVRIPMTSPSEQKRIVRVLDEAFEAIAVAKANAEKNLRNARALYDSTFDALTAESKDEQWARTTVADVAAARKGSIRTGPFGSQLLHGEFVDKGIAVLGIDNAVANEFQWGKARFVTREKYEELRRYRVFPGDVIITIMGTCGRCAIVPDDIPVAINTKHLCCITLDQTKCLPPYLHAYFLHHKVAREYLAKYAKGSIMDGLNMGLIKDLPLLLPPLKRQKEIICTIESVRTNVRSLEGSYKEKLAALDELKKSLLHQAFTGRL